MRYPDRSASASGALQVDKRLMVRQIGAHYIVLQLEHTGRSLCLYPTTTLVIHRRPIGFVAPVR